MINKLIIENFRCFDSLTLDFTIQPLEALVGENGTGKTSILEAIDYATSKDYASRKITEQDFCNTDKNPIKIEVYFDRYFIKQMKDGYTTKNVLCDGVILKVKRRDKASPGKALSEAVTIDHAVHPVEYKAVSELDTSKFPKDYNQTSIPGDMIKTTQGYQSKRASSSRAWDISSQSLTIGGDLIGYPSIFYFDRSREMEARIGYNSLFQKIVKELNWRYRKDVNKEETIKLWESYYDTVVKLVEDPKQHKVLEPLRENLQKILSKDFNHLEISLLHLEQPFIQAFFSLRNEKEMNQIDFSGLGSGVSTIIAYVLLKVISERSKEEVIFLIDEPEMHLHPQAQYKLFEEFADAKHQIIYTTHSDYFVSLKYWGGVIRFSLNHDIFPKTAKLQEEIEGHKIEEHLNEISKWHHDETIYFRENNELFFARKVLLVEGPAEKYGIPRLAKLLDKGLDDLTIISCNSITKIPYYQLLCRAFGIPYFTLFDLDGKTIDQGENKRATEWSDNGNVKTFTSSFETLLGIGGNASHKGSSTLIKIDSIQDATTIDPQISTAIEAISSWALS